MHILHEKANTARNARHRDSIPDNDGFAILFAILPLTCISSLRAGAPSSETKRNNPHYCVVENAVLMGASKLDNVFIVIDD